MDADRVLILAAHPDDEVIGAGGQFAEWGSRLTIVQVTSGVPRDLSYTLAAGYANAEAYGSARFEEAVGAGALAGIGRDQYVRLGFIDQDVALNIGDLVAWLSGMLDRLRPEMLITHPYEGGHPDHDAVALAAARCRRPGCALWEFTSYHAGSNGIETGCFLGPGTVVEQRLPLAEQSRKRRMLDCFRSQRETLQYFGTEVEKFRPAPAYDFTQPPHEGQLYYERHQWGMTGERFRELASHADRT